MLQAPPVHDVPPPVLTTAETRVAIFARPELEDARALLREELTGADGPTALLLRSAALELARYQHLIAMADAALQEGAVELRTVHQQFERYADRAYSRALRALREARRGRAGAVQVTTGAVNVNFGIQEAKATSTHPSQRGNQHDLG